jgi:prepilin-type N-terminal cleavage/methylation domain-containing protein
MRTTAHHAGSGRARGMTVLELMIVLAIIAAASLLVRSGFRLITRADLVENATELSAVMKRASSLAIEHGELHRVTFDLDRQVYAVEVCQGATAILRNEQLRPDAEAKKNALERGKQRLANLPSDALAAGDPEEATRRATSLAGNHIADRTCAPASDTITGDASSKGWIRALKTDKGVKFKQLWVQHKDDSVTSGQVAIYFFPNGSSEKAVVEITDGSDVFSVLVFGLTGRVELRDGPLADIQTHMLRNVMGDRDAKREDQK